MPLHRQRALRIVMTPKEYRKGCSVEGIESWTLAKAQELVPTRGCPLTFK